MQKTRRVNLEFVTKQTRGLCRAGSGRPLEPNSEAHAAGGNLRIRSDPSSLERHTVGPRLVVFIKRPRTRSSSSYLQPATCNLLFLLLAPSASLGFPAREDSERRWRTRARRTASTSSSPSSCRRSASSSSSRAGSSSGSACCSPSSATSPASSTPSGSSPGREGAGPAPPPCPHTGDGGLARCLVCCCRRVMCMCVFVRVVHLISCLCA